MRPKQPPAGAVGLDHRRALLRSFAAGYPVVTVHPERYDPDGCLIGEVLRIGRRSVRLRHVTPGAKWEKPTGRHQLDWIAKVDVGGSYEQALLAVRAQLHSGVVAYGDGDTEQAAIDDLREGLLGLLEEFGAPRELTLVVPDAA